MNFPAPFRRAAWPARAFSFAAPFAFVALVAFVAVSAPAARAADAAAAEDPYDEKDSTKSTGKLLALGTRTAAADIAPASSEAADALKRMKLPPGLVAKLWAAEPMLANPVAFNFDEQGRAYVAETYRYRSSVLDIRDYMWTLEDELANRTTAEWLATMRKSFGEAGLKELSHESERIRLLEDTKHTGVADKSTLYAEGFNAPQDGIASGVLARRGKVFFTNIPHVWMLQGETAAPAGGPAVKRTAISSGYGVRFNFTGHDLHGLIFGPDGKLYFSNGDRGAHATGPDGSVASTPDNGAVYRCNPDGTQLEVFATGLRNPQSLAFNEFGDLFTGDNDCDQGDEERLVHVVEGGDSGWRVGYQFPPLGKNSPWLADKLWQPRSADQAAYLLPPICNIEDGPSGIAYYPGTGLNDSYRGALFVTHFKGAIAKSGIYTYTLKPSGASYAIADAKPFLTSALPTDVKFAPDGRLYISDWADGWPKSKRGRLYAISDPRHENDALIRETEKLIGSDWTKKSADELAALLAHPDWRVRLEAQFTLAERGAESVAVFARVAQTEFVVPASGGPNESASKTELHPKRLARLHAIWGLGQIAAKNSAALEPLRGLTKDADSEVRAQSIKVLGAAVFTKIASNAVTFPDAGAYIAALADPNSRVKFFAAQSLGKIKHAAATPALLTALRANNDTDAYLRHAFVLALANCATDDALAALRTDPSRAVRLGAVLALRRLRSPEIAPFLGDKDTLVAREAALAINDAPIPDAFLYLSSLMAAQPKDEAVLLRILNAHFRLGTPANAYALAQYARLTNAPPRIRAEALAQLALWPAPPQRDRLVGTFRPLEKTRDIAVARDALAPVVAELLDPKTPAVVQTAVLDTLVKLEFAGAADTLLAVVENPKQSADTRTAALTAMDKLKHPRLAAAVKTAGASADSTLRLAALAIGSRLSPDTAAPVLASLVAQGTTEEKKTAFRALGGLKHPTADTLLLAQLQQLAAGTVPPAVQLELLTAAARRETPEIKQLLAARDAALAKNPDPLAPFRVALEGGSKARGARIFTTQPTLACVRCHRVGNESGGEAGPNLAEIGAKQTREFLLESILKPNAKIAPGYDTVVLTLKAGGAIAGVVTEETAATVALRDPENKLHVVKKTDIAKREGAPSSMPEIYATILSKSELRDVVEYLASLTEKTTRPEDQPPRALHSLAKRE